MTPRATTFRSALAAFIIVILVAAPQAQQATAAAVAPAAARCRGGRARPGDSADRHRPAGRPLDGRQRRVADRAGLADRAGHRRRDGHRPGQLLIHGKQPGTISLFVWDRGGAITTYEVKVRRDLSALVEQIKQLFPGEPITVIGSGKDVVISGTVSSQYVVEKAASVAAGYVEKKSRTSSTC